MLSALGVRNTLITDGKTPLNLYQGPTGMMQQMWGDTSAHDVRYTWRQIHVSSHDVSRCQIHVSSLANLLFCLGDFSITSTINGLSKMYSCIIPQWFRTRFIVFYYYYWNYFTCIFNHICLYMWRDFVQFVNYSSQIDHWYWLFVFW